MQASDEFISKVFYDHIEARRDRTYVNLNECSDNISQLKELEVSEATTDLLTKCNRDMYNDLWDITNKRNELWDSDHLIKIEHNFHHYCNDILDDLDKRITSHREVISDIIYMQSRLNNYVIRLEKCIARLSDKPFLELIYNVK